MESWRKGKKGSGPKHSRRQPDSHSLNKRLLSAFHVPVTLPGADAQEWRKEINVLPSRNPHSSGREQIINIKMNEWYNLIECGKSFRKK